VKQLCAVAVVAIVVGRGLHGACRMLRRCYACSWYAVGCLLVHDVVERQQVLQLGHVELNPVGMCDARKVQQWSWECM
jgi:hypothetical protein